MIFTLTLTLVWSGYYAHKLARNNIVCGMFLIFVCQMVVQMFPCYSQEKYEWHRTAFYVCILIICLGIAVSWCGFFASEDELKQFSFQVFISFVYLGIGFFFWSSKYPERLFKKGPYAKIVHLAFQSHIWWHLFVTLSGYTLYWLLFDFNMHVEKVNMLEAQKI